MSRALAHRLWPLAGGVLALGACQLSDSAGLFGARCETSADCAAIFDSGTQDCVASPDGDGRICIPAPRRSVCAEDPHPTAVRFADLADVSSDCLAADLILDGFEVDSLFRVALTSGGYFSVRRVMGDVIIRQTSLEHLDGLSDLTTIEGKLVIEDNPALLTCAHENEIRGLPDGLSGLVSVGGNLELRNNGALLQLGLSTLSSVFGDLILTGNPALSEAETNRLLGSMSVGGSVTVRDNGGGG